MIYIYAVVEGQTEEKFIKDILNPYLEDYGKFINPIIVKTKTGHKGGITEYKPIKKDILSLLRYQNVYVTTMIDYYGLPSDFPGMQTRPKGDIYQKVSHLELEFHRDINHERFIPYIQIHEFESLLFSDIQVFRPEIQKFLHKIVNKFPNPEEINDNPNTAPSKRIEQVYKKAGLTYNKLLGVEILKRIGINTLKSRCQHFRDWIDKLISLQGCNYNTIT